jgi:hypothetical protein
VEKKRNPIQIWIGMQFLVQIFQYIYIYTHTDRHTCAAALFEREREIAKTPSSYVSNDDMTKHS